MGAEGQLVSMLATAMLAFSQFEQRTAISGELLLANLSSEPQSVVSCSSGVVCACSANLHRSLRLRLLLRVVSVAVFVVAAAGALASAWGDRIGMGLGRTLRAQV